MRPPRGLRYILGTWSGRLLAINTAVWVWTVSQSGFEILPSHATVDVLLELGAKDPIAIASGEWWRFLTPVFLHIGFLHFAFNALGLHALGYPLEYLIGGRWFVTLYLATGFAGNIASAVYSTSISAGASGALFGLMGAGLLLERMAGQQMALRSGRRPRGVYASMAVANIALGLLIPGIDNAAHLGGFATGILGAWIMLRVRPNALRRRSRVQALLGVALLACLLGLGARMATSREWVQSRIENELAQESDPRRELFFLGELLRLNPGDASLYLRRARVYGRLPEDWGSYIVLDLVRASELDHAVREVAQQYVASRIEQIRGALVLDPRNRSMMRREVETWAAAGHLEEAHAALARWLEISPTKDEFEPLQEFAEVLEEEGLASAAELLRSAHPPP